MAEEICSKGSYFVDHTKQRMQEGIKARYSSTETGYCKQKILSESRE